jgi:hypothetical protein
MKLAIVSSKDRKEVLLNSFRAFRGGRLVGFSFPILWLQYRQQKIYRLLIWLSSYVTNHYLSVVPESSTKDQFHNTVYYVTLNSICEVKRVSKNFKHVENRVRCQV